MENTDLYKGLKEIAEKQLREIHKKGSMTIPEAEAVKTAMCIIDICDDHIGEEDEYSERSSRRNYVQPSYRRYAMESYVDGRSMRGRSYDGMAYDDYPMDSYRGGSYRNQTRDRMGRYSSHSIDDRVVDMLEKMMDTASSDYEHQRLMEYIRYIRSNENRE